jgi:hypothetical protein
LGRAEGFSDDSGSLIVTGTIVSATALGVVAAIEIINQHRRRD